MKWIVFAAVLALAAHSAEFVELNDCVEGTCPPAPVPELEEQAARRLQREAPAECREGTVWQEDCNTCRCANGRKVCTYKLCLGSSRPQREAPAECREGTVWQEDCNTCRCANGRKACTYKLCLGTGGGNRPQRDVSGRTECTPGSTWKQDCNSCRCTSTGRAACTLMACLNLGGGSGPLPVIKVKRNIKPVRVGDECQPGTSWKRDCNSCRCSSTGIAMCTLMHCLPQPQLELQPVKRDVTAVAANAEVERRCAQGEVWKQSCNTCRCTPDGVPACTKMRCIQKPEE